MAAASSSRFSATRASPLACRAMAASAPSAAVTGSPPSPRSGSRSARSRIVSISAALSGLSTNTFDRDSSAAFTSNDGFSVVAPISTMSPASTRGRNASCCALLKRWISSTNRIVRRPSCRRAASASAITALMSRMPDSTALKAMKCACVTPAMRRAMVVLPVPGGPHRMIDCSASRSIASRSGWARRGQSPPGRPARPACAAASVRRGARAARAPAPPAGSNRSPASRVTCRPPRLSVAAAPRRRRAPPRRRH